MFSDGHLGWNWYSRIIILPSQHHQSILSKMSGPTTCQRFRPTDAVRMETTSQGWKVHTESDDPKTLNISRLSSGVSEFIHIQTITMQRYLSNDIFLIWNSLYFTVALYNHYWQIKSTTFNSLSILCCSHVTPSQTLLFRN